VTEAPVDGVAGVSWAKPRKRLTETAKEAIRGDFEIPFFIAEQVDGLVRLSPSI
jgi:hypothetical protein